ncbi:DNA repair protein XRCC4 isoform X1 [Pseudophryne corroboree]|uniref:DNA repair protein XRCC4 isoform X1 n=1 Tax=Pseudophryne corroboree TaxID=495146 RepID=UPI0030817F01
MDMEKKVRKITVVSDPEATYFLQIGWEKDLGKGFEVTLCDGHIAWVGAASEEDVSREAADMEMEQPKYVEELKKALITVAQPANKYSFDLVKDGDIPEMYYFTYEKKLKDVSFKLGSLRLKKAPNPAEITRQLINYCLNCTTELLSRNEHLLKENERLRSDWNYIHDKLEQFVNSKEELERDLYTKFTCVLNEKKAKIRSMNEKLSQTQQKVQEKSSSSIPFDTVPVAELTTDDYNGSTDDDRKISEVTKETAMAKKSAEKMREYRARMDQEKTRQRLDKARDIMRRVRQKPKSISEKKAQRDATKLRVRLCRARKKAAAKGNVASTSRSPAYKSPSSLGKALSRVRKTF